MKRTRRYITIEGKERIYKYNYGDKHIRKQRIKCPRCGNFVYQIYTNGCKIKIGFWCKLCDNFFFNGKVNEVFRVKLHEWGGNS